MVVEAYLLLCIKVQVGSCPIKNPGSEASEPGFLTNLVMIHAC